MENWPVGGLQGGVMVGPLVPHPKASMAACRALRGGGWSFSCCPLPALWELPRLARASRDVSPFPTGTGSPAGT